MRDIFERRIIIGDRAYLLSSDDDYLDNMTDVFEPAMTKLYNSLIGQGDTVIDVGANIGMTALLFSQLASRVKAYEPSPSTFRFLESNINRSGCDNVEIFNFGLGSADSNLPLTHSPSNRSGGFVSDQTEASEGHVTEDIVVRKGDPLLSGTEVDFIKIDVEGFEMKVLEGLRSVVKDQQPVTVIELNHWCLNAFQRTSIPDFFDFLRGVFPILYAVDQCVYADLYNSSHAYNVMYHHILHFRYPNIIGAFCPEQLDKFFDDFTCSNV
jgi:FkbM family methyltransferase